MPLQSQVFPPSTVVPLEIAGARVVESKKLTGLGTALATRGIPLALAVAGAMIATLFVTNFVFTTEPCLIFESISPLTPINVTFPQNPSSTSPSSTITASWNVSFRLYNRVHAKITYYDNIDVTLYYRNVSIGHTTLHVSNLHQVISQTRIHITTRIDTESAPLDDVVAYSLARDIDDGRTTAIYELKVVVRVRILPNWRLGRKSTLKFNFDTTQGSSPGYFWPSCSVIV